MLTPIVSKETLFLIPDIFKANTFLLSKSFFNLVNEKNILKLSNTLKANNITN